MRGARDEESDKDGGPSNAIAAPTSAFDGRLFADFSGGRNELADLGINVALLTTGGASAKETRFDLFSQFAEADTGKLPVVCSAPLPSPPDGSVGSSAGSRSSRTIPRSTPRLARPRLTRLRLAGTRGFTRRFSGASIASSFPAAW
jgi:hypothetical protein